MPTEGQVYDLKVVTALGPWGDTSRHHPGLIISQALTSGRDSPVVVVPMTGTVQAVARPTHVEISEVYGSLDPPMWILCEYPITIPSSAFQGLQPRGVLPPALRAVVRTKLGWYLRVPIAALT
jgi:mRNA-degrading endonuclease toxin of MazEF toxin-antitoxin module